MIGAEHQEEEILGKAYDSRLMLRVLRYLRPYWKLLAVSFVFLMLQTGAQLLGPYITKIAIDQLHRAKRHRRPRSDGAGLSWRRARRFHCRVHPNLHDGVYRPTRHARFAHGDFFPFAEAGLGLLRPQPHRPADDAHDQ